MNTILNNSNTSKTILENATSPWADHAVEEELSRWMVLLAITFPITTLLGGSAGLIIISSLSIVSLIGYGLIKPVESTWMEKLSHSALQVDLTKLQTDSQLPSLKSDSQ